jgi:hypothetical protein
MSVAAIGSTPALASPPDPASAAQGQEMSPPASTPDEIQPAEAMADDPAAAYDRRPVIPVSSPTPADQAYRLKAGDQYVTANAPVADTPQARKSYGGPDSNGGRMTRAVGN